MPPETLQDLQDLEITGAAGSQQRDETQYELIQSDEQPAQPFRPDHPSAPHQPSEVLSIEQPHTAPFYPPHLSSFGFDSNSTIPIPIDPGLLDARFDRPAAPGPGGGGVAGFHQDPWVAQTATSVNMGGFMMSPTSLPQYNSSMPLVPGMSSFEPMVSTTWSMDGSLPSTSASRGPTMSSSLSVPSTSTPASSQSPSSPRKVSTGTLEPPAAHKEAVPIHLGMQVEPRAEHRRRQASGPRVPPKTSAEKSRHRNNSAPGFTAPQIPIAPAIRAVATTSDDKNNNIKRDSSSASGGFKHQKKSSTTTTAATTSNAPSDPPQPWPPSQQQSTTIPAQQQQQQQAQPHPQPDPRARNREAANRCRAKSKVAVAELEATERAMGAEHHALTQTARSLREEVLSLKNQLLMHGNCDDDLIQQYLANSARMVGSGVLGPVAAPTTATVIGDSGVPPMPPVPLAPGPGPGPGPSMMVPPVASGGSGSSSSRGMLPAVPPGVPPGMLPSSAVPGPGTIAARGHRAGHTRKH